MGWLLCIALTAIALIYLREIFDIALIILLVVGLERLNSLMGGFNWEECVIFGVFFLPVVIYFFRTLSDSQHNL